VPSIDATVLPAGSIDGYVLADNGFAARQAKRLLVLGGLIVGFWVLASMVHSAHASAAPSPSAPAGAGAAVVGSVAYAVTGGPTAKLAPTHVAGSLTAPIARSVENVADRVDSTLPSPHIVGIVQATTHPLVTAIHRAPSTTVTIVHSMARTATATGPATETAIAADSAHSYGVVTATFGLGSSRHSSRSAVHDAARLAGPLSLMRSLTVDGSGGTGGGSTTQSSGGSAAGALPSAAFAPTSLQMSARSSHRAATLRGVCERPSFSPD
jgi:hypothetical protein